MRESAPLWTFQGGASPTALSISLDGKFAGVGHKSGLTLLNQNGRPVWNNNKIRRIKDISVSTRTGKMSIASAQKVVYLVKRTGEAIWHRELQSSAVSTSISSNGDIIFRVKYNNNEYKHLKIGDVVNLHLHIESIRFMKTR